jgi:hypothetical protein
MKGNEAHWARIKKVIAPKSIFKVTESCLNSITS